MVKAHESNMLHYGIVSMQRLKTLSMPGNATNALSRLLITNINVNGEVEGSLVDHKIHSRYRHSAVVSDLRVDRHNCLSFLRYIYCNLVSLDGDIIRGS